MEELLIGVIASTLNLDATELTAELKDGDNWLAQDQLSAKLKEKISEQVKAAKDAQHKRGIRESNAAVEKWIKAQGFNPEGDLKGQALLEAYSEHLKGDATKVDPDKAKTLTKEELAALPEVKALMANAYDRGSVEVKAKLESLEKEYSEFKTRAEREQTSEITRRFVTQALEEGDVLLEPTGVQGVSKEKRIETVLRMVTQNRIKVVDKGGKKIPVFVDEDGNPLEDDMGRELDFSKTVISEAQAIYGPRGIDPKKSGGDPKPGTGGKTDYKPTYTFADEKAYTEAKFNEPDPAKRAVMAQDFAHQQQQAAG